MDSTQKALVDQYKAALKESMVYLENLEKSLCENVNFNKEVMTPIIHKLHKAEVDPDEVYPLLEEFTTEHWKQVSQHIAKHLLEIVVINES